jgi:hypothetical protein
MSASGIEQKKNASAEATGKHNLELRQDFIRLRIYVGEDKRHGERPLYQAILRKAREQHLAGATILRGTQGFGSSTHLHTVDVLYSEDLPVVIEIIDRLEKIQPFVALLEEVADIALVTSEKITVLRHGKLHARFTTNS